MSLNKESVWQVIAVVAMSAFIGGAIERGVFARDTASDKDVTALAEVYKELNAKVEKNTERLSRIEGKLDIALDSSRSRHQ